MTVSTRIAVHVALLGAALVVVAVRPAQAASSWSVAAGIGPTWAQPTAPSTHVRTRPARHRPRRHVHHAPVHAAARPRVRATPAPTHHSATRAATVRPVHVASRPTGWWQLDAAIARIPSYRKGSAHWVVSGRYGHWGTADWYHDTLYIEPTVPSAYLYDVAVHEWSHELSVLDYNGNVASATAAMGHYFGGTGLVGAERAADCMAILQGASWTHYTTCVDAHWRVGAAVLLRGGRL